MEDSFTILIPPEDWLTHELFTYCEDNGLIDWNDKFEDWMYEHTSLLIMVKEHMALDDLDN